MISALLAAVLVISNIPVSAGAEDAETDPSLCEHHTSHTECSYAAAVAGVDCGHIHDENCYVLRCAHVHEVCGYTEEAEDAVCAHICSQEAGCENVLSCVHIHEESCAYVAAVEAKACDFVCEVCTNAETVITEETVTVTEPVFVEETVAESCQEEAVDVYFDNDIAINVQNFPDSVFRQYILDELDLNGNDYLSTGEIISAKVIDVSRTSSDSAYNKIVDMTGIEHFRYLEELRCDYNLLSYLDVSENYHLETLMCSANQLTGLNVSGASNLKYLTCSFNRLTSLDVSGLIFLNILCCDYNQLVTLDVSDSNLMLLDCSFNQLLSLDVQNAYPLRSLICNNNRLQSLDITSLYVLENLDCSNNQLSSLNLGRNKLTTFSCEGNAAAVDVATNYMTIDLTKLPGDFDPARATGWYNATLNGNILKVRPNATKITYLYDVDGDTGSMTASFAIVPNYYYHTHSYGAAVQVSALKIRPTATADAVYYYSCECGQLSAETFVAAGTAGSVVIDSDTFPDTIFRKFVLENIDTDRNQLLSIGERDAVRNINLDGSGAYDDCVRIYDLTGIEHFTQLVTLNCYYNKLSTLDLSRNTQLTTLNCEENQLTGLDLSGNRLLTDLNCRKNQLTYLDIRGCTALKELDCAINKLSSLDLRHLQSLETAYVSGNEFQSFLVAGNTSIKNLSCSSCDFTALDVSGCSSLADLDCDNNLLTQLNVQNCSALKSIRCAENQLSSLDLSSCANLTFLRCINNNLESLDISKCSALEKLYCNGNRLTVLDLHDYTSLSTLHCQDNQLKILNVTGCSALKDLNCSSNQLTSLDLSGVKLSYTLACSSNQYTILVDETLWLYDLSLMPEGFDPAKTYSWSGATLEGNMLKIEPDREWIRYSYDSFGDKRYSSPSFTLNLQKSPHTVHRFTQQIPSAEALKTPPTATADAIYYKSCICGLISTNDQENFAAEGTSGLLKIDAAAFPDSIFRSYVAQNADTNRDGLLSVTELEAVVTIDVSLTESAAETEKICDLTGIEKFTNLQTLLCSYNNLTSLDVRAQLQLKKLECAHNALEALQLPESVALRTLDCSNNQLTELDVSMATLLDVLNCAYNKLDYLDLSVNKGLDQLNCSYNHLPCLTVMGSISGSYVSCEGNEYTVAVDSLFNDFDLTKIPGFVPDNSSNWKGATREGNLLKVNAGADSATYYYDFLEDYRYETAMFKLIFQPMPHTEHRYTQSTICPDALKTPSTMTDDAVYYMSCPCGVIGNDDRYVFSATGTAGSVYIDSKSFPDATFRKHVLSAVDKDKNQYLSASEAQAVFSFSFSGTTFRRNELASLAGLEYFTNLQILRCVNTNLTSLDVSKNTRLRELECSDNPMHTLNASGNAALTTLYCYDNQLTSLILSGNSALSTLHCYNNQLTELDLSGCPELSKLRTYNNALTSLDLSKNTKLTELDCGENQLANLDLSNNTKLTRLDCSHNQLTALDTSNNTALATEVSCAYNQLTSLNLANNASLTSLFCCHNQLSELDLSDCTSLSTLNASMNSLTTLDLSKNLRLRYLYIYDNPLNALDLSKHTGLWVLHCYNDQLTVLDVSACTELVKLHCYNNYLTVLNLSNNTALKELYCYNNQLASLDASNSPDCQHISAANNKRFILLDELNQYDLSQLPEFDVAKASNWNGGVVRDGILTVNKPNITYSYQVRSNRTVMFTLQTVLADEIGGACGKNLTWTFDTITGKLTISGNGPMDNYEPFAPWYDHSGWITQVIIEEGITSIGDNAFRDCSSLTETAIPAQTVSVGAGAFSGCGNLEKVSFEGSAPAIGEAAFSGVSATALYPAEDTSWTADVMQNYGGSLHWRERRKGDLNLDGAVDCADAVWLLWHALFPEDYPIDVDADYNHDGEIVEEDAVYLLWHTLFPDVFTMN